MRRPSADRDEDSFYEALFAISDGYLGFRGSTDQLLGADRPAELRVSGGYVAPDGQPMLAVLPVMPTIELTPPSAGSGPLRSDVTVHRIDERTATVAHAVRVRDDRGDLATLLTRTCLPATSRGIVSARTSLLPRAGRGAITVRLRFPPLAAVAAAGLAQARPGHGSSFGWAALTSGSVWLACRYRIVGQPASPAGQAGTWTVRVTGETTWSIVLAVGQGRSADAALAQSGRRLRRFADRQAASEREHTRWWSGYWRSPPLEIAGRGSTAAGARYAMLSLAQSADRTAGRQNIPPRGLTSSYHGGNFFFNTDLFMVPYFSLTDPPIARSLLRQRIAGLPAAVAYARRTGCAGARYPLVAGPAGEPAWRHPDPRDRSHLMSACVLYGLHRYLSATGDWPFIEQHAAALITGIGRYYAGLLSADGADGRRGVRDVTGFDEHHPGVDHHWATNYLARWSLLTAAAAARRMSESGGRALDISPGEVCAWTALADACYLPAPVTGGVLPEFDGYLDLPDLRRPPARARIVPAGAPPGPPADSGESLTRQIKQADVVLLLSMFPHEFSSRCRAANLDFYEPRTLHASSLSLPPHATVAASLRRPAAAAGFVRASLRYNLDYRPRPGYRNGIHLAAYAGAWLAIADGFLAVRDEAGRLAMNPWWPAGLPAATVRLTWHGRRLRIDLGRTGCTITLTGGSPIAVRIAQHNSTITAGGPFSAPYQT